MRNRRGPRRRRNLFRPPLSHRAVASSFASELPTTEAIENTCTTSEIVYPFGHLNVPPRVGAEGPRRAFVLLPHGDALWATWQAHRVETWGHIPIASEPEIGWNGEANHHDVARWREAMNPPSTWGRIQAHGTGGGDAVLWVEAQVLAPLDLTRDEAWFSACLPQLLLTEPPDPMIAEVYERRRKRWRLPAAHLPMRPPDDELVAMTLAAQVDRLRNELQRCQPERVIAIGEVSQRVLRALLDPAPLKNPEYGRPETVEFKGRSFELLALIEPPRRYMNAPRHERRRHVVPGVHQAWLEWAYAQPRKYPHPPCPACGARWVLRRLFGSPTVPSLRRLQALQYGGVSCVMRSNAPNWVCMQCQHEFVDLDGKKSYRWVTDTSGRGIVFRMVTED